MGLWDKIKGEFIDVIEWVDDTGNSIVWKFPRYGNEIKNGAQLIVRESQVAVFMHEGEMGDIFPPGRHELTTNNMPVLTTLQSWKYGFGSPFKCDIFFVSTKQFTDLKWGTRNPVMMRDPEFGPIRLRAFGSYCMRVSDPGQFIRQIAGTDTHFETEEITGQIRNILVSRFADALAEARIPALDLAANYNEMGSMLQERLQPEIDQYGIELTKFLIENISLPDEVERALDKRTQMGVIGNMNAYTQFQTAEAIEKMAENPGGSGSAMGMIAGMGMGNIMGGTMQGAAGQAAAGQQSQPQAPAGPPPLNTGTPPVLWYAAINNQQAGPFTQQQLQDLVQQRQITADTLVWRQGMTDWTRAGDVAELDSMLAMVPPPFPPPTQ